MLQRRSSSPAELYEGAPYDVRWPVPFNPVCGMCFAVIREVRTVRAAVLMNCLAILLSFGIIGGIVYGFWTGELVLAIGLIVALLALWVIGVW